jgi:hypothetical protein
MKTGFHRDLGLDERGRVEALDLTVARSCRAAWLTEEWVLNHRIEGQKNCWQRLDDCGGKEEEGFDGRLPFLSGL